MDGNVYVRDFEEGCARLAESGITVEEFMISLAVAYLSDQQRAQYHAMIQSGWPPREALESVTR